MKIINKLKDKNGSAMVLAIILMLVISVVIVMFSSQISNGFKVTSRNYEDLKVKYILEAGIEHAIGKVCTNIEYEYEDCKKGKEIIYEPAGNFKREESFNFDIDVSINNKELGYSVDKIKFNMNIYTDKYKIKDNEYRYLIKKVSPHIQKIKVKKEHNGKQYEMEADVEFSIEDLKEGTIQYTIKSWKQTK